VQFWNATDPFLAIEDELEKRGAIVEVVWPHATIGLPIEEAAAPLGENQPLAI
jgi:two-component system sensor histidine kinase RegB